MLPLAPFEFVGHPRASRTIQTEPSVKSVRLIGSWDNFTTSHPMERDTRRDRGQWKGCYNFGGLADAAGPSRDGGLKMGNTYYYYYELDGTHETHDPSRPSTRACPSLPGQPLNTLTVPTQRTLRKRSASLSSMRPADFMTTNPRDKYTTPRPAPAPSAPLPPLPTAHLLRHRASSRSLSPSPSWRRFFRRSPSRDHSTTPEPEAEVEDDARSVRSYGSARSRDISPESLSRFLRDDPPAPEGPAVMVIPEEEEGDDDEDENFASAGPEGAFPTGLAPPPFRRPSPSPSTARSDDGDESPVLPDFERRSRFSFSSVSSCSEAASPDGDAPAVYGLGQERCGPGAEIGPVGSVVGVEELGWVVDAIKS